MKITRATFPKTTITFTLVVILAVIAGVNPGEVRNVEGSISIDKKATDVLDEINSVLSKNGVSETPVETTQNVFAKPNDPYYSKQWAFDQMNITKPWEITTGTREILIAILDTGIDCAHEDLKDKVVTEINFTDSPSANDFNGHGTHIAGIIAATADNGLGIAGLIPVSKIMNVKVADDYGFCQSASVAEGIIWAVKNGAKVINISLEIHNPSLKLEEAVNYAWDHGVIIIAAAGNQGSELAVYPGYYENCIAVAAVKPDNTLAPLSNYGEWVDVTAPGFNIFSTLPGNKYGYETGTSFAAAYVTGLAAIFFTIVSDANCNGMFNDEVRSVIEAHLGKHVASGIPGL